MLSSWYAVFLIVAYGCIAYAHVAIVGIVVAAEVVSLVYLDVLEQITGELPVVYMCCASIQCDFKPFFVCFDV